MRTIPYLYFHGDCEAALRFYETCGLGRIQELRRYAGTPMENREGGAWRDKVIHARFEGDGFKLYAGDTPDGEAMKGAALLIQVDDAERAAALFQALGEGGKIKVPFKKQFWGAAYGSCSDKFGVQWAVMASTPA
jgi:PhnB protein